MKKQWSYNVIGEHGPNAPLILITNTTNQQLLLLKYLLIRSPSTIRWLIFWPIIYGIDPNLDWVIFFTVATLYFIARYNLGDIKFWCCCSHPILTWGPNTLCRMLFYQNYLILNLIIFYTLFLYQTDIDVSHSWF